MVRSQHRVQVLLYCTWCESSCSLQSIKCVTLLQIQHFTSSSPQKQPAEREEDLTKSF